MNYLTLTIILIAGIVLGIYLGRRREREDKDKTSDVSDTPEASSVQEKEPLIEKQAREKEEHKQKIMEFFKSREKATNDDIEALLAVSNATAERYLDELEEEGRLVQIGRTGRSVYYKKP